MARENIRFIFSLIRIAWNGLETQDSDSTFVKYNWPKCNHTQYHLLDKKILIKSVSAAEDLVPFNATNCI